MARIRSTRPAQPEIMLNKSTSPENFNTVPFLAVHQSLITAHRLFSHSLALRTAFWTNGPLTTRLP
jgi:hypothetical protein